MGIYFKLIYSRYIICAPLAIKHYFKYSLRWYITPTHCHNINTNKTIIITDRWLAQYCNVSQFKGISDFSTTQRWIMLPLTRFLPVRMVVFCTSNGRSYCIMSSVEEFARKKIRPKFNQSQILNFPCDFMQWNQISTSTSSTGINY